MTKYKSTKLWKYKTVKVQKYKTETYKYTKIQKSAKRCKKWKKHKKHKKTKKNTEVQKNGHQPLFELQTPDFAWKYVWTVSTNYTK